RTEVRRHEAAHIQGLRQQRVHDRELVVRLVLRVGVDDHASSPQVLCHRAPWYASLVSISIQSRLPLRHYFGAPDDTLSTQRAYLFMLLGLCGTVLGCRDAHREVRNRPDLPNAGAHLPGGECAPAGVRTAVPGPLQPCGGRGSLPRLLGWRANLSSTVLPGTGRGVDLDGGRGPHWARSHFREPHGSGRLRAWTGAGRRTVPLRACGWHPVPASGHHDLQLAAPGGAALHLDDRQHRGGW